MLACVRPCECAVGDARTFCAHQRNAPKAPALNTSVWCNECVFGICDMHKKETHARKHTQSNTIVWM